MREEHHDSWNPEEEPSVADYASRVAAVAAGASADPADIAGAVAAHASTVGAGRAHPAGAVSAHAGTGDDAAAVS